MEAEDIELSQVDGRQTLERTAVVELIEGVVGALHPAVEKVAGIGSLAEVGQFRVAAVNGEISGRSGAGAGEHPRAGAGKAEQVENIRRRTVGRTIGDTAHRMSQFMQRNANQQVRIDVGRKGSA